MVFNRFSGNENLTSIKGHNSVTVLTKMAGNSPKLDLVSINAYLKVDVLSMGSQDINQGPSLCYRFAKTANNDHLVDLSVLMHIQNLVKFCPLVLKIFSINTIY